ncbi:MAG: hypothetical protein RI885_163 [Actinomycetota bacterium]|jgi:amylosucrase
MPLAADMTALWTRIVGSLPGRSGLTDDPHDPEAIRDRFAAVVPTLEQLFTEIYGDRTDCAEQFEALLVECVDSWTRRPVDLLAVDDERIAHPEWFQSGAMLGGVCYVDRYAGDLEGIRARIPYFRQLGLTYLHLMPLFLAPENNSDGGYAVSSYREVDPSLGSMDELRALADDLRAGGISLVVDFIFNHTSNEHEWAKKALARDPFYEDFYWIFPDRDAPDRFEETVREIFPDDHPGSFVPLDDGRWIWATFHHFQWDLNYSNPAVFRAMAGEMLFLASLGVDILRMDAVAFIWKRMGTSCESLPEAHLLLKAFNAVCRLAAPALLFKSEAIVHPDEVAQYIDPAECQLSYNPLQMALIWESLATRRVSLLAQALERRHAIPAGTAWINYVRGHDDIGWTFSDEDAAELGIDGYAHRRFLNAFYVNRFDGSFARGVPFQDNPRTGDCRISGTTASLAGLEQGDPHAIARIVLAHSIVLSTGGIPLLYLGDEVGQLNDYSYVHDPDHAADSRWVNRPRYPVDRYADRFEGRTDAGRIYGGLTHLIELRTSSPELAGGDLIGFGTGTDHVLGYQRPSEDSLVLVLANFSDEPQSISPVTLSGMGGEAFDLVEGRAVTLADGIRLAPYEFAWLRVVR